VSESDAERIARKILRDSLPGDEYAWADDRAKEAGLVELRVTLNRVLPDNRTIGPTAIARAQTAVERWCIDCVRRRILVRRDGLIT
jgi:hypothetical protein